MQITYSVKLLLKSSQPLRFKCQNKESLIKQITKTSEEDWFSITHTTSGEIWVRRSQIQGFNIREYVRNEGRRPGVTVKEIAETIGMPYVTLVRKINKKTSGSIILQLASDRRVLLTESNFTALETLGLNAEHKKILLAIEERRKN